MELPHLFVLRQPDIGPPLPEDPADPKPIMTAGTDKKQASEDGRHSRGQGAGGKPWQLLMARPMGPLEVSMMSSLTPAQRS